jgi:transposase-like protein
VRRIALIPNTCPEASMFIPPCCPHPFCSSHERGSFSYHCRGSFRRALDGRIVQRYACGTCGKTFSDQTFRLDYRLRRPNLTAPALWLFASKVTHRQAARFLHCARGTVHHRLELLGRHCRDFHARQMKRLTGALSPYLALDELETYETDRRLKPVTVPVLLHEPSWFVLDVQAAPLPSRGGLRPKDQDRRERLIEAEGRRRSGSTEAVGKCLANVAPVLTPGAAGMLRTDQKKTYVRLAKKLLPQQLLHVQISSEEPRGLDNPLFRINTTLAMMRDGVSRLVRRTWGASKLREQLEKQLWIWVVYRNYVRRMVNRSPTTSAASLLGLFDTLLPMNDLLGLRPQFRADPPGIRTAS